MHWLHAEGYGEMWRQGATKAAGHKYHLQKSTELHPEKYKINEDITFSITSNLSIGFKVRPDKRQFHHPKKCSRYVTCSMYIPGKPVKMLSLVSGNEHQGP